MWGFITDSPGGFFRTNRVRMLLAPALAILVAAAGHSPVHAEDINWLAAGVRTGVGDTRNSEQFTKSELFLACGLPYTWESDAHWLVGPFLGINAGFLLSDENTFVGSAGPGLYLLSPGKRLALFAGVHVTYLSRSKLDSEDFGGSLQFTSTVGIDYILSMSFIIGYSFQHMSNAGLFMENPGLNTHMLELIYRF
ncbi:acyloxyacyl hydrolase [Desulfatitalea tepidiphila]|uniref:acyloxyacyl hydrolase n=1 Tax=Desulfatitalea tepidiphila TaxID=1185843 RepID=UPI0009FB3518|nr:acyloxyacyl hydrolase [Desulfatitalea tepidiphila]